MIPRVRALQQKTLGARQKSQSQAQDIDTDEVLNQFVDAEKVANPRTTLNLHYPKPQ